MKKYLFIALSLYVTYSAKGQNLKVNKNHKNLNVCNIIKKPLDCNLIKQNARILLSGEDNCVLTMIDSIYSNIIISNRNECLEALDSICRASDGYVADYLEEIGKKLFYKRLPLLSKYRSNKKIDKPNTLENIIVEGISQELSEAEDIPKKKKKIETFVKSEIKSKRLTLAGYSNHSQKAGNPKIEIFFEIVILLLQIVFSAYIFVLH